MREKILTITTATITQRRQCPELPKSFLFLLSPAIPQIGTYDRAIAGLYHLFC